jgi:hypothetical protein
LQPSAVFLAVAALLCNVAAMRVRRGLVGTVLVALAIGCSGDEPKAARREPLPPPPGPIGDAGEWASRMGEAAPLQPFARRPVVPHAPRAALMSDDGEATEEPVLTGRLVYRVSFFVPPTFRDYRGPVIQAAAGELQIDVSVGRLRARFVGPGWPVDEGTEVRLRSDLLGVYLFDGAGGRSLGSGQLAAWFEGRGRGEAQTQVVVRREYESQRKRRPDFEKAKPVPGELLCALLAEWSNQERSALGYRCVGDSLPPSFRVGPWSAELTAVVPMERPRRALRADQADPPGPIAARGARMLLEAEALERLRPLRPLGGAAGGALEVENRTDTRAIVIAQGVALGWVDPGQTLRVDGFLPGYYRIGAIRPLGVLRMPPRLVRVPGKLIIGLTEEPDETAEPAEGAPP